ncbi:permease [Methanogenium sp. S4BF]|uniref:hypothetical protein n=1 Tax=Methanogenium sp. S4BF TaxID=1789226 RepID=UPI002415C9F5|nr:hypothetical protein [Methanogenium sp. S4BF]WFN34473.1 permease [Methanogenium sp. S4BF]
MKQEGGKEQKRERKENEPHFPLIFLGIAAGIYCIAAIIDGSAAIRAFETFIGIFRQIIPVLVLVFVLMFLIDIFVRPTAIAKHLGSESGMKGWILAIIAGVISSGPVYIWYSMLADFREKGMRTAFAGTFLYIRSIKLPLLPMMIFYFGGLYTTVLTAYLIVFSVIVGMICEAAEGNPEIPASADKPSR